MRSRRIGPLRLGLPFTVVHLGALAVPLVGWSPIAVGACVGLYVVRALGITVVYHRGLAHRSFRMPRPVQALGAVVAATAAQRGPLWWVAHHRAHHRRTDRVGDPHSPQVGGLLWSHLLWMFARENQEVDLSVVADLARWPELGLLDRFHHVAPVALALATLLAGTVAAWAVPGAGVTGPQLVVWAFCVSTVLLWHSTFAVNSLGHSLGQRRFETRDASRNLWWLALLTMGEGWHNNHHRFPPSARLGLARSELDPGWWVVLALSKARLATDHRVAPAWARRRGQRAGEPELSAASGRPAPP